MGRIDQAIQDFGRTIEVDLNYALAFYSRCNGYQSKGDHDSTIEAFTKRSG